MSDLPNPATLIYNGVFFAVENMVEFESVPVPDAAGRTVTETRLALTVKAYISADKTNVIGGLPLAQDNTEAWAEAVRQLLQQPGGALTFYGLGIGDIIVNDPKPPAGKTSVKDIHFGPWPKVLDLRILGGDQTIGVVWKVETTIAGLCPTLPAKGVKEFNYKLSWDIDPSGYQRRTYSGHLVIAGVRKSVSDRTLSDQADAYREKVWPALLPGFRRVPGRYDLRLDKCRLDFSCTDIQMPPNQLPPGVVEASASHRVEFSLNSKHQWINTLSAEYEMSAERSRADAWQHFVRLFTSRMAVTAATIGKQFIIPMRLSLAEPEIYGKKGAAFSLSYFYVVPLEKLVRAISGSGLWTATPENDWSAWSTSLVQSKVFVPRGHAGLGFDLQSDAIVDLCQPQGSVLKTPGAGGRQLQTAPPTIPALIDQLNTLFQQVLRGGGGGGRGPEGESYPDPAASWVDYQLWLQVETVDSTVELVPLPTAPIQYAPPATGANDTTGYRVPYKNAPTVLTQYRGPPRVYVTLSGRAVRAGHPITPPQLRSVGGIGVVPMNREGNGFRTGLVGDFGGVPVNAAAWSFRYLLPQVPTTPFVPPPNPLHGVAAESPPRNDGLSGFIASG